MNVTDLIKITEAPAAGQMLVYTRKNVIFQPYTSIEEVIQILTDKDLLEIHLFDEEKEYRAVMTRSARFENGIIEKIADFKEQSDVDTYADETVLADNETETMTIINHIHYNAENGMADIDDYRLKMGGAKK